MKTSHLALTLFLILLVMVFGNIGLVSCCKKAEQNNQNQVEAPPVDPNNNCVSKFSFRGIYNNIREVNVVKVDGKEYVVIASGNGIAICPK